MENKWIIRFLDLAEYIGGWSKDPSSKIGAVVVDENRRIVSTGYNGFARKVEDLDERLGNREVKYRMVLHAEENAILYAKRNLENCSLFVSMMPPCSHCAAIIIQSGIKRVYTYRTEIPERWKESFELTETMFGEAGVELVFMDRKTLDNGLGF